MQSERVKKRTAHTGVTSILSAFPRVSVGVVEEIKYINMGYRTFALSSCKRILVSKAPRGIGLAAKLTSDSRLAPRGGRSDVCVAIVAKRACSARPLAMSCTMSASSVAEPSSGGPRDNLGVGMELFRVLVAHLCTRGNHVQREVLQIHTHEM